MSDKKFPKELLTASAEAKKKYWKEEVTISHPNFNNALNIILDYIKKPTPPIIVVRGPAGAGKTKLAEVTAKKICSQYDLNEDQNHIPAVYYKVLNFSKGNHDWKVTFINLLQIMGEPLIEHKVVYHEEKILLNLLKGDAKYGIALINTLRYRQTAALILDEAHHISKIAGGRKIQDQLDVLKILADLSNTKIILFGNYELNIFLDLNDQVIRREKAINLMRYILYKKGDKKKFKSVLNSIQLLLPLEEEIDLVSKWDSYYERSLGCIGILYDWVTLALYAKLDNNENKSFSDYMENYALTMNQCLKMVSNIKMYEMQGEDSPETQQQLRIALGLNSTGITDMGDNTQEKGQGKGGKNRDVATRNPVRDPVGDGLLSSLSS